LFFEWSLKNINIQISTFKKNLLYDLYNIIYCLNKNNLYKIVYKLKIITASQNPILHNIYTQNENNYQYILNKCYNLPSKLKKLNEYTLFCNFQKLLGYIEN